MGRIAVLVLVGAFAVGAAGAGLYTAVADDDEPTTEIGGRPAEIDEEPTLDETDTDDEGDADDDDGEDEDTDDDGGPDDDDGSDG